MIPQLGFRLMSLMCSDVREKLLALKSIHRGWEEKGHGLFVQGQSVGGRKVASE